MDPNGRDEFGLTAVHKAALIGDWEALTELIKQGGDPLLVDDEGRNALFYARVVLRGFEWAAEQAFAVAGARLDQYPFPPGLTGKGARDLGSAIFQRGLQSEHRRRQAQA